MDSLTIIFILNGVFFISLFLLKNIFISLGLSLVTLFTLLFVSKKQYIPSFHAGFSASRFTISNNHYTVTIACLLIFLLLETFIGFTAALFAAFFIFSYLNKVDSRTSFFVALVLLVITAFLSASGNTRAAEDIAILVYYFLVIGVVWQIIELRKEKPEEEVIPIQKIERVKVISHTFMRHYGPTNNFFTKKNVIMISVLTFLFFALFFSFFWIRSTMRRQSSIKPIAKQTIAPSPTPFKHVPFAILNATSIRGFAASSAATLRKAGWDDEFDMTIGNYEGSASANILKYTKTLEKKIKLLELDLNIQITPIVIKEATRGAEMTLILGEGP